MNIVGHIKVNMTPTSTVLRRLGVTAQGDVQRFHTANVRRRIQRYMPYRSGAMIKLMIVHSPTDDPFGGLSYAKWLALPERSAQGGQ